MRVWGVAGLILAVGLVAGCTSAPGAETPKAPSPGGGTSSVEVKPASLALVPAAGAADVEPGLPVSVAVKDGKVGEVTLTGADGKQVQGKAKEDGSGWESAEPLGYGKSYTVNATATGTDGKPQTATSTFTTAKAARQMTVSINATDGETVGVGMPLIFTFGGKVPDKALAEKALKVTAEPATEGAFKWFGDQTVIWRPKEYWKSGTKVTVDAAVYGRHLGNGTYGKEDRTSHITIGDKLIAEADGSTFQMKVSVNDAEVKTVPISMGKPGHNTPLGTYTVMSEHNGYTMDSGTYGVPEDSPGGYRTFVQTAVRLSNSGIFYHSAPWSVGQQGKRNVSHGCLNLSPANAKWLMDLTKRGDIVTVTGSGGKPLEPTDGWSVWQLPWDQWKS
ncbi:Lipoprotein-anchoring transpeptidase ErfK/SrfK [Amycolatopsis xylanica]|uniref:Lipoprotein-anchoring transpeptidase ErfK/SrfK n=1 Tax=Amycolatopsis xylanica TaxID=589385 RepID=A0A1H3D237_9PSEU|nr:Ig-like domain-containing protein [Amycolatopsis xylanica]SDX60188.1 Lipoprotein-anchoring transpeptidase ErfK/SrfK [Amycolatopsis xylanica]